LVGEVVEVVEEEGVGEGFSGVAVSPLSRSAIGRAYQCGYAIVVKNAMPLTRRALRKLPSRSARRRSEGAVRSVMSNRRAETAENWYSPDHAES
jgi:hypothetical protein